MRKQIAEATQKIAQLQGASAAQLSTDEDHNKGRFSGGGGDNGGNGDGGGSDRRRKRRVDAATQATSHIGKAIDVLVKVCLPDSPRLSVGDWPIGAKPQELVCDSEPAELRFTVNEKTGELESAKLKVRVAAPEFDIDGDRERVLLVPPLSDSRRISFLLTPRKRGVCRVNIELYDLANTQIGNIAIATAVDSRPTEPAAASLELNVRVGPSPSEPNKAVQNEPTRQVVLLVHGIRDFAKWQQMVTRVLQTDSVIVIPIKYGYFDVFLGFSPLSVLARSRLRDFDGNSLTPLMPIPVLKSL